VFSLQIAVIDYFLQELDFDFFYFRFQACGLGQHFEWFIRCVLRSGDET
jgi:hypothetical protein